uniref:Uncharacterized protein n=1 Tax=Peronospora matthiolae TaxID=2874970 RepID=A0AAV1T7Q2_9STRA
MWWSSTKSSLRGSVVEHLSCKQKVPGSIPGGGMPVTRCYCTRLGQDGTGQLESAYCWFHFFWTIIHDYWVGSSRKEHPGFRSQSTPANEQRDGNLMDDTPSDQNFNEKTGKLLFIFTEV